MSEQNARRSDPIKLSTPIERGETKIEQLTLRKPRAGEMRGLSLQSLLQSDIDQLLTLIPRISEPSITDAEANALEPEDLAEIGGTVFGFFMTAAQKERLAALTA